jgi:hypothetical protein
MSKTMLHKRSLSQYGVTSNSAHAFTQDDGDHKRRKLIDEWGPLAQMLGPSLDSTFNN